MNSIKDPFLTIWITVVELGDFPCPFLPCMLRFWGFPVYHDWSGGVFYGKSCGRGIYGSSIDFAGDDAKQLASMDARSS